jgi:methyl-accepting chemotaxis protein
MSNMLRSIAQNAINLNDSSTQMSSVSQSLGLNATETSDKANAVSKSSTEINRDINTVATAVDQMSTSIVEISRNAGEATRVAAEAVQVAEQTNRIVRKLGDSSTDIGNVVKVITTIAQQTNLLALNATIEAARAGEAGKGFAVVANEVKELAKATAKATEEIGQKVEAIQSDTHGAVGAITQISTIIDHMNDIFNTIASAVEEQTATANEISRSVGNAAQGSTGITTNIGGVADAARRTSDFADGTKTSANDLEQMARQLRSILDKFQFVQEAASRKSEDEFVEEDAALSA